jgi:hypothetical protein
MNERVASALADVYAIVMVIEAGVHRGRRRSAEPASA